MFLITTQLDRRNYRTVLYCQEVVLQVAEERNDHFGMEAPYFCISTVAEEQLNYITIRTVAEHHDDPQIRSRRVL